jgi:hypothetical protein
MMILNGDSMMPRKVRFALRIAAAAVLSTCCLLPVSVGQTADSDADLAARDDWSAVVSQNADPREGCFQVTFPSIAWEQVECKALHPRVHPVVRKPGEEVSGNGNDYVAESSGLTSGALGSFPTVSGVKSEKSVGVAEYGDGGILGPNEYSLQLNTNFTGTTTACDGHSGCVVWQQFIYATDYAVKGKGAVFMQYWLIGWGSSACPSGFGSDGGGDCYGNSKYVEAPDVKPTSLGSLSLRAPPHRAAAIPWYLLTEALPTRSADPTVCLIYRRFGKSQNSTSSGMPAVRGRISIRRSRSR